MPLILAFQNILSVGMPIHVCPPETVPGCFVVFGNAAACEVFLSTSVLPLAYHAAPDGLLVAIVFLSPRFYL